MDSMDRRNIKLTTCLLITVGLSSVATLYAYYSSNPNSYGGILVAFIGVVSLFGTLFITLLLRLIYCKFDYKVANIITAIVITVIIAALLWHFKYHFDGSN